MWLAKETHRDLILPNVLGSEKIKSLGKYLNQSLWPGFRVVSIESELKVNVLEPSYYWRVKRDYDPVPDPHIVYFNDKDELRKVQDIPYYFLRRYQLVFLIDQAITCWFKHSSSSYLARFFLQESGETL